MSNTVGARLKSRYAAERRFKAIGMGAVLFSALVLAFLLVSMTSNAVGGFTRAELRFDLDLSSGVLAIDPAQLQGPGALDALKGAGLPDVVKFAASKALGDAAAEQLADNAWQDVGRKLISDPSRLTAKFPVSLAVSDDLASALRGDGPDAAKALAAQLKAKGSLIRAADWGFLSRGDATGPQSVGIWGALKGSMLTMLVTLLLAFPIGVLAAVYLEEFAPRTAGQN